MDDVREATLPHRNECRHANVSMVETCAYRMRKGGLRSTQLGK